MSRRLRMTAFALVTVVVFAIGAGWLGLSYLGILTRDVRVEAALTSLGDSLGPGSKVRYHGLIVGTVHDVGRESGHFSAELLINRADASEIPTSVVARVLPATLFGSEYVELVSGKKAPAASGEELRTGAKLQADTSQETVRLMDSFDDADRLLSAVDSEQINASLGTLATALDGHGDDISTFLTQADDYVSVLASQRGLILDDLRLLGIAADTAADIEPRLRKSAENSRTMSRTVTQKSTEIGSLIDSSRRLTDNATRLMTDESDQVVRLLRSTGPTLNAAASHDDDVAKIFDRVPIVVTNGAKGINDYAVQMEGMIGLDPLSPYTAADCVRFGAFAGSNCGNAVPTTGTVQSIGSSNGSQSGMSGLAEIVQGLLEKTGKTTDNDKGSTATSSEDGLQNGKLPLFGINSVFASLLAGLTGSGTMP